MPVQIGGVQPAEFGVLLDGCIGLPRAGGMPSEGAFPCCTRDAAIMARQTEPLNASWRVPRRLPAPHLTRCGRDGEVWAAHQQTLDRADTSSVGEVLAT